MFEQCLKFTKNLLSMLTQILIFKYISNHKNNPFKF